MKLSGLAMAAALLAGTAFPHAVMAGETPAPEDARVYISSLASGVKISSDMVHVVMKVEGMDVAKAGTYEPNTGHFHILINTELENFDDPIPADNQHIHYGGGHTEAIIQLPPGEHTLQLLFADGNHIPHNPVIASEPVTITVLPPSKTAFGGRSFW